MYQKFTSSVMYTSDELQPKRRRVKPEDSVEEAVVEEEGLVVDENGNEAEERIDFDEEDINEVFALVEELDFNGMFRKLGKFKD